MYIINLYTHGHDHMHDCLYIYIYNLIKQKYSYIYMYNKIYKYKQLFFRYLDYNILINTLIYSYTGNKTLYFNRYIYIYPIYIIIHLTQHLLLYFL